MSGKGWSWNCRRKRKRKNLEKVVEETIEWLDRNQLAETDEFEYKKDQEGEVAIFKEAI